MIYKQDSAYYPRSMKTIDGIIIAGNRQIGAYYEREGALFPVAYEQKLVGPYGSTRHVCVFAHYHPLRFVDQVDVNLVGF